MNSKELLKEFVKAIIGEALVREVDITSGKAAFGSDEHIVDLKSRIRDLIVWRDRQRKGSEARANYSRIVSRLKAELKAAEKRRMNNTQKA